jgi:hypothetical protein
MLPHSGFGIFIGTTIERKNPSHCSRIFCDWKEKKCKKKKDIQLKNNTKEKVKQVQEFVQ